MKLRVNGIVRAMLHAGVLASAVLLMSCGGGERTNTFSASRVIAFGDESSVITGDQKKYSVNALVSAGTTLDCAGNPLWIQSVAAVYGLAFPQCPGAVVAPTSRIYAVNGALVADLSGQIDQQLANGGFAAGDLVTVLVGVNDVIAQFARLAELGEGQLLANLDAAGRALAEQVNRLAGLGAKVLISTIPDVGLTPFAGDRAAGSSNANQALLSRLSTRFNDALLANLTNDGRRIGLIQLDEYVRALDNSRAAGQGSFANTTQGACAVALPDCTTNTLVTGAAAATWLWADDRRLGAGGQIGLGSLAISRAQNNPF